MPLQFSSGLLSSLGSYGQGDGNIPTDPNQRTMMQQLGVTNPLLQAFGQGISSATGNGSRPVQIGGATIGLDNRSAMDQFKAAASNLDLNSEEGQLQYLRALQKISPEAAVMQAMKFKEMKMQQEKVDWEKGKPITTSKVVPTTTTDTFGNVIKGLKTVQVSSVWDKEKKEWVQMYDDPTTGEPVKETTDVDPSKPVRLLLENEMVELDPLTGASYLLDKDGKRVKQVNMQDYRINPVRRPPARPQGSVIDQDPDIYGA